MTIQFTESGGQPYLMSYTLSLVDGNQPIGLLEFTWYGGMAQIDWIEVQPQYRGERYAGHLYRALFNWCLAHEVEIIRGRIESVHAWNARCCALGAPTRSDDHAEDALTSDEHLAGVLMRIVDHEVIGQPYL